MTFARPPGSSHVFLNPMSHLRMLAGACSELERPPPAATRVRLAGCSFCVVRGRIVEPGGYTPWVIFAVFVIVIVVVQAVR